MSNWRGFPHSRFASRQGKRTEGNGEMGRLGEEKVIPLTATWYKAQNWLNS
ncbi:MAG: hypothetical protein F6K55_24025 [Moorea sp. SIO4A3]|nr:hypothetical protein [Moorena sp. SIO4A3]